MTIAQEGIWHAFKYNLIKNEKYKVKKHKINYYKNLIIIKITIN